MIKDLKLAVFRCETDKWDPFIKDAFISVCSSDLAWLWNARKVRVSPVSLFKKAKYSICLLFLTKRLEHSKYIITCLRHHTNSKVKIH
jgi:hypothetical protein